MNHRPIRHISIASTLILATALLLGRLSFADAPQFRVAFESVPGTEQIEAGNIKAAIKLLKEQIAKTDIESSGDLLATLCAAYIVNHSYGKAKRVCNNAVEVNPGKTAYNNRGVLRALTADMSGAREDFARVRPLELEVYLEELRITDVPLVADGNFRLADQMLSKRTNARSPRFSELGGAVIESLIE